MEGSGGDRPDPARYARDKADNEDRRTRNVVLIGLVLVLALGAVVWAVVTLTVGDSETEDAIEDPVLEIDSEPPPPPDSTPLPLPSASPKAIPSPTAIPTPAPTPSATPQPTADPQPTVDPQPESVNQTPGKGVQVKMGRANWPSGFIQAEIYRSLLQQLGYDVNELATAIYHPQDFYTGMANGQFDFWANGRFPNHIPYLTQTGLTGVARPIGFQMRSGGLEGILVDKATADAHGITRWDDIGDDSEIAALFDRDGNGKADIMGCDQDWACRTLIDDTIAANGWQDTIEQVSASHSVLFAESLTRLQDGEPFLQFVWSPSSFTALMVPGVDVIWLSLDRPLTNQQTVAILPVEQCPGQPCKTGSNAVDIRVVARVDFLGANPAANRLFELVAISPLDISRLINTHMVAGNSYTETDIKNAAAEWIADNRATVDQWLDAARVASGFTSAQSEDRDDPIVAAFVYVSPLGDAGWSWSHDVGRRYAEQRTGATTLFVESVSETREAFRPVAVDLIENEGADIIFGTSFGYMDVMEELAGEYPDVVFENATGFKLNDTNFGNYHARIYQPRYLSGIAAGAMTESDRIGYVAAFPIPEVIRGINAFTLGARRLNPDVEVHVNWTFTWFDPAIEGEAAAELLENGADVLTMHQDSTATGLEAQKSGARWVAYHSDMSPFAPDAHITAAVWNWGPFYRWVINAVADGTYTPGGYWGGMEAAVVGLAPLAEDVPEAAVTMIGEVANLLREGSWDVFTGEIRDQDGNVVVPKGETLDDGSLLNMSYFVEGVVGSPHP